MKLLYVAIFGLLGVLGRHLVGTLAAGDPSREWPVATFAINLVGAFLIGIVYVAGIERALVSPDLRIGLTVGFLGGFTTFSAFSLETLELMQRGHLVTALVYLGLSPVLGVACAYAGVTLGRHFM